MFRMIGFGVQFAGNELRIISQCHVLLNKIFYNDDAQWVYSEKLKALDIIFRVSGKNWNFDGEEGPVRIKKSRSVDEIEMDFVIPIAIWESYTTPIKAKLVDKIIRYDVTASQQNEFRVYVANAVRECFVLLKDKAKKLKYKMNEEKLDADFDAGIKRFLTEELPDLPQ